MITRQQWGAKHGKGSVASGLLPMVVIHHYGADPGEPNIPPDADQRLEVKYIQQTEVFHTNPKPHGKAFSGIGYNFLIAPSGRVYEGRGWRRVGAHSRGENSKAVGVCFTQDGDRMDLTPASVEACRNLLAAGIAANHLAEGFTMLGHGDAPGEATKCPGALIKARIPELRPGGHAPDGRQAEIERGLAQIEQGLARIRAAVAAA